jgi:hypothetical protein
VEVVIPGSLTGGSYNRLYSRSRLEVRGGLAAILRIAQGVERTTEANTLAEQIKMVAGAGFEPAAFRL